MRIADILWSKDGSQVAFQIFSHDNKDRWIAAVGVDEPKLVPLERIHEEAWINWRLNQIGWLRDSETLFYTSEESGYSQLYLRSTTGTTKRRLTQGSNVVSSYGRDWRTAIYRQMGTPELEDLKDGVRWLVENKNVDPERVGVYGGSYGGFMTFMALFRAPDLFACGAALRPVSECDASRRREIREEREAEEDCLERIEATLPQEDMDPIEAGPALFEDEDIPF